MVDGATTTRLGAAERRDALLQAAADLVVAEGVDAVSMESVAAAAGVSRPLVYKHFANRDELLTEVYQRESDALDAAVLHAIAGLVAFDDVLRASVRATFDFLCVHGRVFTPLAESEALAPSVRSLSAVRSRRSRTFFGRLAAASYGIDRGVADDAVAMCLAGLDGLLARWGRDPRRGRRRELEDLYVTSVLATFERLAVSPPTTR